MSRRNSHKISERAEHLLKILVDRYIRDGQPVGSRTLSKNLELSAATIRNVMADLEDMGLVCSPHTSAGRIPTALGYRVFVDSLLQVQPLNSQDEQRLRAQLNQAKNEQDLIQQASHLLSEITHLVGVVMLPRHNSKTLRHVEFLPLSGKRVLVILVINEQEVQNRILTTTRRYSASELEQAANYLNAAFTGKDIDSVRQNLLKDMRDTQETLSAMMQAAIEMADKAFLAPQQAHDMLVSGQTNLLDVAELSNVNKLRELFSAFNQKRDILGLLDQALDAQGVQIFIGEESGYDVLGDCSIVTAPYGHNGSVIGVLGVVGPTRMEYQRVIPIVDLTAKLLGSAL